MAYSVLSSPSLRQLYDEAGMPAIRASWQLGPYTGGQDERRRVLEAMKAADAGRIGKIRSSSMVSSGLDATAWFDDYSGVEMGWTEMMIPSLRSLSMQQSFESYLGPKTKLSLGYGALTERGTGYGTTSASLAHQLDADSQIEGQLSIVGPHQRSALVGFGKSLRKGTMFNARLIGHLRQGMLLPVLQGTLSQALPFGMAGSSTLLFGAQQGIILTLTKASEETGVLHKCSLHATKTGGLAGKLKSSLRIDDQHSLALKLSLNEGSSMIAFGLAKQWTPKHTSEAFLECHPEEGVTLRLGFGTSEATDPFSDNDDDEKFRFSLPIRLSSDISPTALLFGAAIPALAALLMDMGLVRPLKRYLSQKQSEQERLEMQQSLESKKQEALMVAELLKPAYDKRLLTDKLVIRKAVYNSIAKPSVALDVTAVLQVMLTHEGTVLAIPGGRSKSALLGFYDIAPGPKALDITYEFAGRLHQARFDDLDPILLPQRHHTVI